MSTVWFTADPHFGHANIVKYCQRPFLNEAERQKSAEDPRGNWKVSRESIDRHDETLLQNINSRVQPNDQLWILGDFCLGKFDEAKRFVDRIACKNLKFIWGNHDHPSIEPLFQRTEHQAMIKIQGQNIFLNHYPMRTWDKRFHGSWSLYGHVHDRLTKIDQQESSLLTKDVGVDACDYYPISFDQLQTYMRPRIAVFQELKQRAIDGDELRPGEYID